MGRLLAGVLLFAGAETREAGGRSPEETPERTLYFFFSPEPPSAPTAARALATLAKAGDGSLQVRPVLLVEDWKAWKKPSEKSPLTQAVRELAARSEPRGVRLPVFDEEGLRLARAWKLSRLPAFVLVAHGKAHVVYGSRVALEELSECDR